MWLRSIPPYGSRLLAKAPASCAPLRSPTAHLTLGSLLLSLLLLLLRSAYRIDNSIHFCLENTSAQSIKIISPEALLHPDQRALAASGRNINSCAWWAGRAS